MPPFPRRIPVVTMACILAGTGAAAAQRPTGDRPPRRLTERPAEFPETFSSLRSITALPDGRLVITDPREKRILLLDFAKGTSTALSRTGGGPREYQVPGGSYRAPRGGALIYDQRQQRFLPVSATGTVLDVLPLPLQPGSISISDAGPDQFVVDTLGNSYTVGALAHPRTGHDSLPLLRLDHRGVIVDTIAFLLQQEFRSIPGPNPRMSLGLLVGFAPQDLWAVAPDGAVAVIRAEPYRVDWFTPARKLVRGQNIAFTPLPVTDADHEAARAQMRAAAPPKVTTNGVSRNVDVPAIDPPLRDVKPPFPIQLPRIDEQGRLWIERSSAVGVTRRSYDVFDRRGALVDRVELPDGSRLVGFDTHALYAARIDEDDLLHLQRFRLP